jgi:hypothetical protein
MEEGPKQKLASAWEKMFWRWFLIGPPLLFLLFALWYLAEYSRR